MWGGGDMYKACSPHRINNKLKRYFDAHLFTL